MATARTAAEYSPPVVNGKTRRRLRTRRALQRAALQLFAERGYEETTVADIANRAEVSVRTFFLHFPFKEAVLFDGSLDGYPELHRLVVGAPEHLSDLAALEYALLRLHTSVGVDQDLSHRMVQLLVKADAASSVVRGRRMENAAKVAEAVARALAERRGEDVPSLATATLAEMAMRIHHLSVTEWAAAGPGDLPVIVERRFATLRTVCADRSRVGRLPARNRPLRQGAASSGADALLSLEADPLAPRG